MNPAFVNIFIAMDRGIMPWAPAIFGLLFLIGTAALWHRREFIMMDRSPGGRIAVCVLLGAFSALLCFGSGIKVYLEKSAVDEAIKNKTYKIVTGIVTQYKAPFKEGSLWEKFCLIDQCFYYSDYIPTYGFHDTKLGGGPIRNDLQVAVYFVDNVIFRLDVVPPKLAPVQR
jgi:hypothetical protein